jgi:5'-nucleotidase
VLILLTNDDGIRAPGIVAMYRELTRLGEVHVVAPETVQSATGHGITLDTPLLTQKVTVENAFTGIAIGGRPADCVKVAVSQILPRRPDLVVSGMNSGANVGINVIYSGTVAAAIEAAFLGLPSVAVSLYLKSEIPLDFARPAMFALQVIQQLVASGLAGGQCASINLPPLRPDESPAGVKVARQCLNPWTDEYERRADPRGREYFWSSSVFRLGETEDDTDVAALRDRFITVTPLQFDLTNHRQLDQWRDRTWNLSAT